MGVPIHLPFGPSQVFLCAQITSTPSDSEHILLLTAWEVMTFDGDPILLPR